MMKHLLWGSAVVAAFICGLMVGEHGRPEPAREPTSAVPAAVRPVAPAPATSLRQQADAKPPTDGEHWQAALGRLDALTRRGDLAGAAALSQQLLDTVRERARGGGVAPAQSMLAAYLARNPYDAQAHLLDSDLRQMQGRADEALQPLLTLLRFTDDPALIEQARDRLALLANVRESQLANRGDVAGLIRFFEALSAGDPLYDGHRLRLAQWLLRAGRLDEAARVLAETGTVGVDPQAREDLAATLALARRGMPLERRADAAGRTSALHVSARAGGHPVRLLVDTGATSTAISRQRAEALGSRPTGQQVPVRTAGGVVQAEVHLLRDVEVGGLRLDSLEVLVLDQPLPDDVDGLLGMDVLGRFPDLAGAALPAPR